MRIIRFLLALAYASSTVVTVQGEAASQDLSFPLYKMQDVLGRTVTTQEGKEAGKIDRVVLDAATGEIVFIVIASGGVLGLGSTLRMLPWGVVQVAPDRGAFQLHIDAETFNNAPHFDKDHWPDMEDRHWVDAIHVYYGKTPHLGKRLPTDTSVPVTQGPRPLLMSSYVLQSKVMNPRGQRLGKIEEVVIDVTAGEVVYVVLAFEEGFPHLEEKWFALPWQALKQSRGLGTFSLAVDVKVLKETPGFHRDRWPGQPQDIAGMAR